MFFSLIAACYFWGNLQSELQHQPDLQMKLLTVSNYLTTVTIIKNGLLKKKLLLSIDVVLSWNSLNSFNVIGIFGTHHEHNCYYWQLEQHWSKQLYFCNSPIKNTLFDKRFELFFAGVFPQKFSNCSMLYFSYYAWNQDFNTKDLIIKLLTVSNYFYNHWQGFIKQKTATLHHCHFNLKFPEKFHYECFFG